jgi:peptidoglycan-associated lipoprotein
MKCSKIMAVAMCGVLAFAVAGCRYDDVAGGTEGDESVAVDVATDGDNANGADVGTDGGTDIGKITDDEGVPATGLPFDQIYKRCTDVDFVPVYFGFDASNLPGSELSKIEAVAKHLTEKTDRVVIVEGNCDERGSNEYNLSLGEQRASSIRDYLVQLGIAADRIQTKSYGEEKPAVTGAGEEAWSKNRRGEFAIFQK